MGQGLQRARAAATATRIGLCPDCRRHIKVTAAGRLVPHGPRNDRCTGSGNFPAHSWTKEG